MVLDGWLGVQDGVEWIGRCCVRNMILWVMGFNVKEQKSAMTIGEKPSTHTNGHASALSAFFRGQAMRFSQIGAPVAAADG